MFWKLKFNPRWLIKIIIESWAFAYSTFSNRYFFFFLTNLTKTRIVFGWIRPFVPCLMIHFIFYWWHWTNERERGEKKGFLIVGISVHCFFSIKNKKKKNLTPSFAFKCATSHVNWVWQWFVSRRTSRLPSSTINYNKISCDRWNDRKKFQ